jgi:uncharacterized protein (TIGR03435 family)
MTLWKCTIGPGLLLLAWQCSAQKPAFDVASIKPNVSGREGGTFGPRGEGFFAVNVTLVNLLLYAYAPPNGLLLRPQIIGGPDWINTDHFDAEARSGSAGAVPREQMKAMLQSLLEDRFQLKVRRETRDLPIYNLVLSKGGPKLSQDQAPPDPRQSFTNFASLGEPLTPLPRGAMRMITGPSSSTLTGIAISVSRVVNLLQSKADRIILDKTGFTGLVDVNIEFNPELRATSTDAPDAPSGPSLFTAVQGIGLKLESAKAPLEVLVIDSVHEPSPN